MTTTPKLSDNQPPAPAGPYEFPAFVIVMAIAGGLFMFGLVEKAAIIVAQLEMVLAH